jgi:hypothetical protein
MDPAQDARLGRNIILFLFVLMGAGVSLAALISVLQGWHDFNLNRRLEAIMFLVMLVLYPLILARTKNQNDFMGRFSGFIFGYVLVLMALITFTSR